MKKLYVGNLPYEITETELTEAFGQFGTPASVKLITDRDTGRGKGFGFVEMESAELAQTVVDELNGKEMFGRTLKIDIAKDRPAGRAPGTQRFDQGQRREKRERSFNR